MNDIVVKCINYRSERSNYKWAISQNHRSIRR